MPRFRFLLLGFLGFVAACASAEDRLNEGIALQTQGRYMQAVYRYADALDKDASLDAARDRMLAAGDSAVTVAMDDADELERRGDPVAAANRYVEIDRMTTRIRQVGSRPILPSDYAAIRRAIFDNAIDWQMVRGDEALDEGRWADARGYYVNARNNYLPSRAQVEESYDAETRLLLAWAGVELQDGHPRAAYDRAEEALGVRSSPARETVLAVRDLQDRALQDGTVVIAVAPVVAEPGVRDWLGGEFEVELDRDLGLDHWIRPPLFVEMADPLLLRSELRGLLRGRALQSPTLVGRALGLIGADLGVMIRVVSIEVTEDKVNRDRHETVVDRTALRRTGLISGNWAGAKAEPAGGLLAAGRADDPGAGNRGRGPADDGNNGRGPRDDLPGDDPECRPGNNGRGPPETGNRGRGPDQGRGACPETPDQEPDEDGDDTRGRPDGGGAGDRDGQPDPQQPDQQEPDQQQPDQQQPTPDDGNRDREPVQDNRGNDTGSGSGDPVVQDRTGPDDPRVYPRDRRFGDPTADRPTQPSLPGGTVSDTVTYATVRGTMTYHVVAEVLLVDVDGREVSRFTASSTQSGPFVRGEFDGDPAMLRLPLDHEQYFDPRVISRQMSEIELAVLEELASAIAVGTFDQVLAGIP